MAEILIQRKRRRSVWPWLLGLLALALLPLPFMNDREELSVAAARTARRDSVPQRDTTRFPDSASNRPGAATAVAAPGAERTTATSAGSVALPDTTKPGVAAPTVAAPTVAAPTVAAPTVAAPTVAGARAAGATAASSDDSFARFIAASNPNADERAHRRYTADGLRRLANELRSLGAAEAGVKAIRANADSLQRPNARRNARPDYARAAFLAAVHEFDLLQGRYRVAVDTGRLRSSAWAIKPDRPLATQRGAVQRFFENARDALHSLSRRR